MTHAKALHSPHSLNAPRFFALVAGPLLVIYLLTGTYTPPYGGDRLTNALTAAAIADDGTAFLDRNRDLQTSDLAWVDPARDGHVAGRNPPGAALWAVPFYLVDQSEPELLAFESVATGPATILHPSLWPATVAASLAVALAMGFLALTLRRLGEDRLAIAGAYVMGLATTAWSVAAESLWMHGPAMLWLALAVYLSMNSRWGSGVAFGLAIVTRPVTAMIAGVSGLLLAWKERSVLPLFKLGIGAIAGLAFVVAYNAAVFGEPSIGGSYGDLGSKVGYAKNAALFLFSPTRGLLVYAPFLVVLALGLPAAWRAAPAWVQSAAVGGAAYFAGHLALNIYSGGSGFPAYRYPLEGLMVMAPLLFLAYLKWVAGRPVAHKAFVYLLVAAFTAQAIWAIGFGQRF